jgi:hypothetical protein
LPGGSLSAGLLASSNVLGGAASTGARILGRLIPNQIAEQLSLDRIAWSRADEPITTSCKGLVDI